MKPRENAAMRGASRHGRDERGAGYGDALAAAALAIIAEARQTLANRELADAEAVHDVRKALKRWRALMRLLSGPVGEQADQMRLEARDLMRALSSARDAQSALDALNDLRKSKLPFSARSMETIQARLTAIRDSAEQAGFTPDVRERLSRYFDFASLSLERWPLVTIDFDIVAEALVATYRRARQLVPDKWHEADAEHLHEFRRRVVELRHQMDLIEPLSPRLAAAWGEEVQRLRNRLGECQDLAMLANFMAPHQPLAHWRSRLAPMIDDRRATHLKTAERLVSRLFAEKPKAFGRRFAALWRTRTATKMPNAPKDIDSPSQIQKGRS